MIMMVVMSLYTVVDGAFVSRLAGTDAFSAVNIIYPLQSLIIGVGTMFGSGTTAIVSRKLGEGRGEEARRILSFVLLATTVLGVALSIVCFIFLKPIIYALGANDVIYGYCRDYAVPLIPLFFASILQLQFQSLYMAEGKPSIGLVTTIIGGVANVVLDYYFIAVLNMGIRGAAIATGIGYLIPAVVGIWYFAGNRKGNLYIVRPKAAWKALFYSALNGSSEMISNLSTSITTFLFNIIMMRLIGTEGVAAVSILLYLDFILVAISLGYSMGSASLFSFNYGRGDRVKLRKLFLLSLKLSIGVGIFMTAGTMVFAEPLTAIFTPPHTKVFGLAAAGMRLYGLSYFFKGFNIFSSAMFTAFGDGLVSGILSFMRTLVFLTASLILFAAILGVQGVWIATPFAELLSAGVSLGFVLWGRKKYHYGKEKKKDALSQHTETVINGN